MSQSRTKINLISLSVAVALVFLGIYIPPMDVVMPLAGSVATGLLLGCLFSMFDGSNVVVRVGCLLGAVLPFAVEQFYGRRGFLRYDVIVWPALVWGFLLGGSVLLFVLFLGAANSRRESD